MLLRNYHQMMGVRNGFLKKAGPGSSGFVYRWVHTVSKTHTAAKMSVQKKRFPIFRYPGKRMQKWVTKT
jgi:hypothetical protein